MHAGQLSSGGSAGSPGVASPVGAGQLAPGTGEGERTGTAEGGGETEGRSTVLYSSMRFGCLGAGSGARSPCQYALLTRHPYDRFVVRWAGESACNALGPGYARQSPAQNYCGTAAWFAKTRSTCSSGQQGTRPGTGSRWQRRKTKSGIWLRRTRSTSAQKLRKAGRSAKGTGKITGPHRTRPQKPLHKAEACRTILPQRGGIRGNTEREEQPGILRLVPDESHLSKHRLGYANVHSGLRALPYRVHLAIKTLHYRCVTHVAPHGSQHFAAIMSSAKRRARQQRQETKQTPESSNNSSNSSSNSNSSNSSEQQQGRRRRGSGGGGRRWRWQRPRQRQHSISRTSCMRAAAYASNCFIKCP